MGDETQVEIKAQEAEVQKPEAQEQEVTLEQLQQEKGELEAKLKQMEKVVSRHGSQDETLKKIHERLDTEKAAREEHEAIVLDSVEGLKAIMEGSEATPKHREQLAERRKQEEASKGQGKSLPKETEKFLDFCAENEIHLDTENLDDCDPLVKEALSEGRNFATGLSYLKTKVKARNDEKSQKTIQETALEMVQQQLKEHGLTKEATAGPSAPGGDWRGLSADNKIRKAVSG